MGETRNYSQSGLSERGSRSYEGWPVKRTQALLGSNLQRNNRPTTHDDPDTAGRRCLPVVLVQGVACGVSPGIIEDRRMP